MTTTKRSPSNSPSAPLRDSIEPLQRDADFTPRALSYTNASFISTSSTLSRDDSQSSLLEPQQSPKELSVEPNAPLIHVQSAVSEDCAASKPKQDALDEVTGMYELHPTYVKSKRSSSASNDVHHERDRFRARFETFNPPSWAITEDACAQDDLSCNEDTEFSVKTKKLNKVPSVESSLAQQAMNLRLDLPASNEPSPLSRDSKHFEDYEKCSDQGASSCLDIHYITQEQLSNTFSWYFNAPLPPTDHMFPWLHGLHPENFAQRSFFCSSSKAALASCVVEDSPGYKKPEKARFLMCVDTTGPKKETYHETLRNTISADEVLQRIEFARSEVRSSVRRKIEKLFPQYKYPSLEPSRLEEAILSDCLEVGYMPAFVNLDPMRGISLRNFQIQVNKASACADFVVYCHNPGNEANRRRCMSFARLLKVAQIAEDNDNPFKYDVFVLNHRREEHHLCPELWNSVDTSSVATGMDARKKTHIQIPELQQLSHNNLKAWDVDFQMKEKLETIVMSAASKLHLNVWSGNLWDHQSMVLRARGESEIYGNSLPAIVPNHDKRRDYCDPENSLLKTFTTLTRDRDVISLLPPPRSHWQLFVHCHSDAAFPSPNSLNDLLFKYTLTSRKASEVCETHQLEFPASGSIGIGDCRQENLMSIVNTCKLLYLYSSSMAEGSIASLIYCSDGYTESSLLNFCFLMYAEDIPLESAMLKLHLECGRPFYIFNSDINVLRTLEVLLRKFSPKRLGDGMIWSRGEVISKSEISSILLKPKQQKKQGQSSIPHRFRLGYIASDSSSESEDSEPEDEEVNWDRNWVEELEGSIPSRILPHVYLGSLKHANCLSILSKLGITKIISVGESVDWLKSSKFSTNHEVEEEQVEGKLMDIFHIKHKLNKHPNHEPQCGVTSVIKLKNLQDDGIDDLGRHLPQVLDYIDEEYQQSEGQTKFLIHCRVGVSRSATVVIAEVMRRLKMNLPQAYLYVRVRRLNIVIQPNLRFMYELLKWEETERGKPGCRYSTNERSPDKNLRVIDWFSMCREIKKLNMPFVHQ